VTQRIRKSLYRMRKLTLDNLTRYGRGAFPDVDVDPTRPRLQTVVSTGAWANYFFPELLRPMTPEQLNYQPRERNPSHWNGRVAGVEIAGHGMMEAEGRLVRVPAPVVMA
jgi:hypothetical protein